jgi:hypothetical protein
MLYLVKIRHEREPLAKAKSRIREWLDERRCEPKTFRCDTDEEGVTFRLEFKIESKAVACASAFGGQITSIGDKFLA